MGDGRAFTSARLGNSTDRAVPPELLLRLSAEPSAAAQARDALAAFAETMPAEALADLRLVVTELVTNSVKYGPGGPIVVSVKRGSDGAVSGEVLDGGRAGVRMRRSPNPAGGGLGLQIVDARGERLGSAAALDPRLVSNRSDLGRLTAPLDIS